MVSLWGRQRAAEAAAWWAWTGRYCLLLLASLAASGAVVHLLKALIGRSRPNAFFSDALYGLGRVGEGRPWDSFPSGHTQVAVTVATVLVLAVPSLRLPILTAAALVGFSRMVTAAHYLSDVLVSAVLCALIVLALARYVLDAKHAWLDLPPHRWWSALLGGAKPS